MGHSLCNLVLEVHLMERNDLMLTICLIYLLDLLQKFGDSLLTDL